MSWILSLSFFLTLFPSTVLAESLCIKSLSEAIEEKIQSECETCQVSLTNINQDLLKNLKKPFSVSSSHWKGNSVLEIKSQDQIVALPATIRWIDNVVVANRNIRQGHQISQKDVRRVKRDVTFLETPYPNTIDAAIGWEGKSIFKRGQVINEAMLRKPMVVKFGQPIKVELKTGSLVLQMQGQARGTGAVGDQIPVYMSRTQTQLSGKIISANKVTVE